MSHHLDPATAQTLRGLVMKLGEPKVLATIKISRLSLARAVAGLNVRQGTLELLRSGLRALQNEMASKGEVTAEAQTARED